MSFSELLKQCRKKQGISQAELASKLGVTQQAVGKWESGKSSPDPSTVARIAELLNTTADYLLGLYRPVSNVSAPEERFFGSYSESLIPVIGTVKAGYGALAFEEDYGQEYARVKDPSNYFYLVVRGDSMEPRIQDGDLALVHKQDTLENGDLGVLIYGDEGEGTLKRYIQRGNCVVLQPFNPAYSEMVIKGEDLNHLHIAGRVVETKRRSGNNSFRLLTLFAATFPHGGRPWQNWKLSRTAKGSSSRGAGTAAAVTEGVRHKKAFGTNCHKAICNFAHGFIF